MEWTGKQGQCILEDRDKHEGVSTQLAPGPQWLRTSLHVNWKLQKRESAWIELELLQTDATRQDSNVQL